MSKYDLLVNQTVTQTAPPPVLPVTPWGQTNPTSPPSEQTFHLVVSGTGAVSATAQVVVSNDTGPDSKLFNWIPYGDAIVATGTAGNGQASFGGTQSWKHFGAYLTAISGTDALANLKMNA